MCVTISIGVNYNSGTYVSRQQNEGNEAFIQENFAFSSIYVRRLNEKSLQLYVATLLQVTPLTTEKWSATSRAAEVNSLTCLPLLHLSLMHTLSCSLSKTSQFLTAGRALQTNHRGLYFPLFFGPLLSLRRWRTSSRSLFLGAPSQMNHLSLPITSDTVRKCRPPLLVREQQQHLAHLCLG